MGKKREKLKVWRENIITHSKRLATGYMHTTKQNIRYALMNLMLLAGIAAVVVGVLITSLLQNMGVGRHSYIQYDQSRDKVQNILIQSAKRLNEIDYMTLSTEITPEELRAFIEDIGLNINESEEMSTDEENIRERRLELFQQYLNDNIVSYYNGNKYYSNTDMKVLPETEKLYNQLFEMLDTNSWTNQGATKYLNEYYEVTGGKIIDKGSLVQEIIDGMNLDYNTADHKTYLLDASGTVLYNNGIIKSINIVEAMKRSSGTYADDQLTVMYPVIIDGKVHYLYSETFLEGSPYGFFDASAQIVGGIFGLILFFLLIFKLTAIKVYYIEYLSKCLGEISKGNLDYNVDVRGHDELAKLAKDMRHMERQLKEQIEERRQAEQTKNELITNVAHDLRTPLTSVIGYVGLVKDEQYQSEEERRQYLEIAYNKACSLKVLIQDLFDFTKLTNQASEINVETLPLTMFIEQLVDEMMPQAEEKGVMIRTIIKADDTMVKIDPMKMARVFENLIGNAIKYTTVPGIIQVVIQANKGMIYTSVRNHTNGIAKEDIDKLFERFYRTDVSRNSETGGSGLGLAIAKSIVDLHGGKIWAQMDNDIVSFNVKLKHDKG